MNTRRSIVALAATGMLLCSGGHALAVLIAYDGFADGGAAPGAGQYRTTPDSTTGSNNNSLVNQGPALSPGFTGGVNWAAVGGGMADFTYFRADPGGLGYTDTLGNVLDATAGQVTLFRDTPGSYTHKRILRSSNDSGPKPATAYFSGLLEFTPGIAGYLQTKWGTKTTIGIGFGSSGNALVNVSTATKGSGGTFAANTTHLVVGKIEDNGFASGKDSVTLYVDPILTDEASNTPTLDTVNLGSSEYVANNSSYPLGAITLGGHSIQGRTVQFDEFRVGTTWADVVPYGGGSPAPSEQTLEAVADSRVRGNNNANDNFGSGTQLRIKRNYDSNWNRKSYIRFDLADFLGYDHVTELADATLRLNVIESGAGSTPGDAVWTFELYGLNDGDAGEGWGESTINWNNAPQNDTGSGYELLSNVTLLDTFTLTGKGLGPLELSSAALTDFIRASTADDLLTFILVRPTAGTPSDTYAHALASKEHATVDGPQLVLRALVIPEPGTLAVWALGLLCVALYRQRRTR